MYNGDSDLLSAVACRCVASGQAQAAHGHMRRSAVSRAGSGELANGPTRSQRGRGPLRGVGGFGLVRRGKASHGNEISLPLMSTPSAELERIAWTPHASSFCLFHRAGAASITPVLSRDDRDEAYDACRRRSPASPVALTSFLRRARRQK